MGDSGKTTNFSHDLRRGSDYDAKKSAEQQEQRRVAEQTRQAEEAKRAEADNDER